MNKMVVGKYLLSMYIVDLLTYLLTILSVSISWQCGQNLEFWKLKLLDKTSGIIEDGSSSVAIHTTI